jgi:L-ribulokinase
MAEDSFVIGVDYGTDSVRALIVNTKNGEAVGTAVHAYQRWKQGKYCVPDKSQFRQHPQDYVDGLQAAVTGALKAAPAGTAAKVIGLSVDTTGSTPCAVDANGTPLALTPGFEENPNAMFVLWKDHTGVGEAEEINKLARSWGGEDYTKYEGGIYSSEWFWAKILHVLREDKAVAAKAESWVEHCDWIPALLTGCKKASEIKRGRCSAGHKAMWHPSWGGLPPEEFLAKLDPVLKGLRARLYSETITSEHAVGTLTAEWASKLGLPATVKVGIGAFDAHMGAVGGGAEPNVLLKIMGTSTCDILITSSAELGNKLVKGICGQVDGSVVEGMMGLEAGQSAFGDAYDWFKRLLMFPVNMSNLDAAQKQAISDSLIPSLEKEALKIPIGEGSELVLDWMNGRRTPDANQRLKGVVAGINLGTDAPRAYRALVESTAYGAKMIVDRFTGEGVPVKAVIALGGVAKKSPFVMQTVSDVLNMPVKVVRSEQACALGAAMFAAVAAGAHKDALTAQKAMGSGFDAEYKPIPANVAKYKPLFENYKKLAGLIENQFGGGA